MVETDPAIEKKTKIVSLMGDICDAKAVKEAMRGCTTVFHCAAIIDWGHRPYDVISRVNYDGTKNVLECARSSGASHFIITSTMDVVIP